MTRNTTSVNATVLLPRSKKALEIAQKIWRLTFIFTTVLAARSIIIIADWFAPVHGTPRGLVLTLALRVLFQALCELVPAALTLKVLGRPIVSEPSNTPLLKDSDRSV